MSVFTKNIPVGVDKPIQSFQELLYTSLKAKWNITNDTDWDCYGRAYRNQTSDGYSPEVYVGNNEYKDVFFDDTLKVLSFFSLGESIKFQSSSATANVSLIIRVNPSKIKPSIIHRPDEEIRNDVQRFCRSPRFTFEMQSFEIGLDAVFKEYSGWRKTFGVKYQDQKMHCFRINFNVVYNIDNN